MGKLTDQQKIQVVELYKSGLSSIKLSKIFNLDPVNIIALLRRRNVEIRSPGMYRKHKLNEHFFDKITTEAQAYWLGFLTADGNIDKNTLRIEINKRDRNHLEKLKTVLDATYPIRNSRKNCVVIGFTSKNFTDTLAKHGIVPNKTPKTFTPAIPLKLLRHFYRGVFDGDGWFSSRRNRNRRSKTNKSHYCLTGTRSHEIGFSSGCEKFIKEIHTWICKKLRRSCGYLIHRKKKKQQCYQLTFGGNNLYNKVKALLYKDATVYLDRKFQIVLTTP
jgi:intein-encoded DNA endonuclease-like protein